VTWKPAGKGNLEGVTLPLIGYRAEYAQLRSAVVSLRGKNKGGTALCLFPPHRWVDSLSLPLTGPQRLLD
jgi:hypothetical protein